MMNSTDLDNLYERLVSVAPKSWEIQVDHKNPSLTIKAAPTHVAAFTLTTKIDNAVEPVANRLLISSSLSAAEKRSLIKNGASFFESSTGTLRIEHKDPPILIYAPKKASRKNPQKKHSTSLSGSTAAKLVRALIDINFQTPIAVSHLAASSEISQPQATRIVSLLEYLGVLTKNPSGKISGYSWERVLSAWTEDYKQQRSTTVYKYLSLQSSSNMLELLSASDDYALTGALAASLYTPVTQAKRIDIYTKNHVQLIEKLNLIPTDKAPDVIIYELKNDLLPLTRLNKINSLTCCSPAQCFVDTALDSGQDRGVSLALLEWMKQNESWRRSSY